MNHDVHHVHNNLAGCWVSAIVESEWGPIYNQLNFTETGSFTHYIYGQADGWRLISERKGRVDAPNHLLIYGTQRVDIEETSFMFDSQGNVELKYTNAADGLNEAIKLSRCKI